MQRGKTKSQGALEYLLLVGGAVLVSGMVLVLMLGNSSAGAGQAKSTMSKLEEQKQQMLYGFYISGGISAVGLAGYGKMEEGSGASTNLVAVGQLPISLPFVAGSTATSWAIDGGKYGNGIQMSPSLTTACTATNGGLYTNTLPDSIKNLPSSQYTIAFWAKRTSSGNGILINPATNFVVTGCGNCGNVIGTSSISIRHSEDTSDASADISFTKPSLNAWHHYAYYFDKPNLKAGIYIDGVKAQEKTLPSGNYGTISWLAVGIFSPTCADGDPGTTFDELLIFNRVLTQQEITSLVNR
ncbi:Concanavalin A-like lectin/glucanases superfamily protein [uncultured archaeon]|nr:Concanavalin A-like lectin/glucanases superfamily protein [uncultured archaeon]